jgi:MSHA type pilus biogenesis protein MshL
MLQAAVAQEAVSPPAARNKISLDIKGMDVIDVLKMLASRADMNIVIGKNVVGRVTLFLKDVDVFDAFEIVLAANDLAYERKGDIINVMTQRDYELKYGDTYQDRKQVRIIQPKYAKAADLSRALVQIKSNIGKIVVDEGTNTLAMIDTSDKLQQMEEFVKNADLPIETRIFDLNYALADKISVKLQEAVTKGIGSIKIDERTNKIAVTDYPKKLDEIERIILAFDEKTEQVLIDAQIIEISPSDKFEMGVDWEYWLKKNVDFAVSMPTVGAVNKLSIGMAAAGLSVTQPKQYKSIIDLLRTIGDTKILSSPRIMAINNQEARILVGTKQPYASQTTVTGEGGTVTTAETVNYVDIGIKLYVTPVINKDGFVTMKIRPEVSSQDTPYVTSKGEKIPVVSTSEAETSVIVKDGVTIIIGGLRKDERTKSVQKMPFLGDIPLVGFLFRNTSDETKKTELVILITPHLLTGATSYTQPTQILPVDGAVLKMVDGEIIQQDIKPAAINEGKDASAGKAFSEYYKLVSNRIIRYAQANPPHGKTGQVNLNFSIASNGQVASVPKVVSSTDPALIPFAMQAINQASPFPPFPPDVAKSEEEFYITIDYR